MGLLCLASFLFSATIPSFSLFSGRISVILFSFLFYLLRHHLFNGFWTFGVSLESVYLVYHYGFLDFYEEHSGAGTV